jgi:hypothetical protein
MKAEKIEVLRLTRARIAQGSNCFICYGLQKVAFLHPRLRPAALQLEEYISAVLKPYTVLEAWQANSPDVKGGRARADRLAWIDWMIADLEKP